MNNRHMRIPRCLPVIALIVAWSFATLAQEGAKPFEPVSGQAGKDVVWVPTPEGTVERMLDVAKVTPQDYVIDLGSGDGRNVIAAARRGATAHGVEWNQDMVDLSKRRAAEAGVTSKAQFVQGDMYAADISKASVLALFLLPDNMKKLLPNFLAMKPGTRIVSNTFGFGDEGWEADLTESVPNCTSWCTVVLWIVPANAAGTWQSAQGPLTLSQKFQKVSGSFGNTPIADGRLRGDELAFNVNDTHYSGRINGDVIEGTVTSGGRQQTWRATRGK
ncbi:MAG TPA: class I SAM-dependent methyltransferase [Terriglobia bacterium]|nr:class I SAM-dependent methyltransferase [Terriglobia bacterium]